MDRKTDSGKIGQAHYVKVKNPQCQPGSFSEVFRLIDLVAKKLRQIQRQTVKETNLTPPQYFILTLLWERDGRTFKELASVCYSSPATITGIIDTLEKKGLVAREPNPEDRRSLLVRLTKEGGLLEESTPTLPRIFGSCCAGLDPDELNELGALLTKLDNSLQLDTRSIGEI